MQGFVDATFEHTNAHDGSTMLVSICHTKRHLFHRLWREDRLDEPQFGRRAQIESFAGRLDLGQKDPSAPALKRLDVRVSVLR